jgi:hypothetical protein
MRSMSMLQLVGGVAVAGAVAAGTTALTGTGLATSGNAASPQFIGGTVSQAVSGATLTDIQYTFLDSPAKTQVSTVVLTFAAGANGKTVAVAPSGGAYSSSPLGDEWYCPAVITALSATCSVADSTNTHATAGRYYTGLTSLAVTVS